MKKVLVVVVVALALAVYFCSDKYAIGIGDYRWAFAPEKDVLARNTARFLDDIKFKDFDHAAVFHSPADRDKRDIPKLIEKKFFIKPEQLDLKSHDVLTVELMGTGGRAKVSTLVHVKMLNTKKDKDVHAIFYWKKVGDTWYMDLQSSL